MVEKGRLCQSKFVGPAYCTACINLSLEEQEGAPEYCEDCQDTFSGFFTHVGAAKDYLHRIGFEEIEDGGIVRFLVPENRSTDGVRWDNSVAERMLTEAGIPVKEIEQTVFEACAVVYDKGTELLLDSNAAPDPDQAEWDAHYGQLADGGRDPYQHHSTKEV